MPRSSIVFNCGDSGPGSLRYAIDHAVSGDVVDMTQLTCSQITLTTGALHVPLDDLTLLGPGPSLLRIVGSPYVASETSVIRHTGSGLLTISDLAVTNGHEYMGYAAGGCIYSAGSLRITDDFIGGCSVVYPYAPVAGGSIFANGNLSLEGSVLLGSYAVGSTSEGGIAFVGGDLQMVGSMIAGGQARGGRAYGGAAIVFGNASISNSSIIYNYAGSAGYVGYFGGLSLEGAAASVTITNSTISNNRATTAIGGVFSNGPLTIANSTIACNTSDLAGSYYAAGVAIYGTTVDLESTIIANNTVAGAELDLSGPVGSARGSSNLIMGSLISPAGTLTADPHLLPLAYNGGLTPSHLLAFDSPAIDAGNNNLDLDYDQRGAPYPRVDGVRADIGAIEHSDVIFGNGFDPLGDLMRGPGMRGPVRCPATLLGG